MIQDANNMFADDLAYGGTPTAVDLGNAYAGPGRKVQINIMGSSLAGITGIMVDHGATSSPTTDLMEIDVSSAQLNKGFTFNLPDKVLQYVLVSLVGSGSAGTWTCGLQLTGGQTNL